ncbi:MAG: insulinase family protein [Ruminococcaceae bacterium]|nr:insulinase family protein [Oscillospiraceae bacterium]
MTKTYTLVTGETLHRIDHASGLTIFVYPKKGYRSTYAMFGTRYGSVDTAFIKDGKRIEVPAGIAHYLEHKLFENEDCDAFERYAKTGASANAFTSFDVTAYLFECSDRFSESLEILLDFVQKPYFTEATVQKEQGIIGQEIRMCEDSPTRRVMFNLLRAMYKEHPVRIDIAGTVESISHITPELLYDCYYTFYNLHNMVLTVCGNATVEEVLEVADRVLIPAKPLSLDSSLPAEPRETFEKEIEQVMPVAVPLFYIGYKCPVEGLHPDPKTLLTAEMAIELLCGHGSELYASLMRDGLINDSFGGELFEGRGFALMLIGGVSRDPKAVQEAVQAEIVRLQKNGVDETRFEELKASFYGRLLCRFNSVESSATALMDDYFHGFEPFVYSEIAASLEKADLDRILTEWMVPECSTLSVVRGKEEV